MINYCMGCENEHDDWAWKYISDQEGWVCTKWHKPSGAEEWVDETTKNQREEYFNSTVQPFRDGELSKEYVDAHGTKGINVTPEEVKKAKDVWKDLKGWSKRDKSK